MSLQLLVFIAQRLDGARPTREFRAGQNGSNQPFSHGKYAENKNALNCPAANWTWLPEGLTIKRVEHLKGERAYAAN
jgi:hypothetical protein